MIGSTRLGLYVCGMVTVGALMSAAAMQQGDHGQSAVPKNAVAVLAPTNDSRVGGVLTLTARDDYVHIKGKIWQLKPGKHGFHIHEFGDLRDPKGESAGAHFNPSGESHGSPKDAVHHAGDLGNIVANNEGVAQVDMKVNGLKLHFVIGRSIVVHAKPDDLTSDPSGESGDRLAVGVIGLAKTEDER